MIDACRNCDDDDDDDDCDDDVGDDDVGDDDDDDGEEELLHALSIPSPMGSSVTSWLAIDTQ